MKHIKKFNDELNENHENLSARKIGTRAVDDAVDAFENLLDPEITLAEFMGYWEAGVKQRLGEVAGFSK